MNIKNNNLSMEELNKVKDLKNRGKIKAGVMRFNQMHLIPNSYDENGMFIYYIQGLLENMHKEYYLHILSPMYNKNEKILNNYSLCKKYPYLDDIKYCHEDEIKTEELDVLFIFPKDNTEDEYLESGISYKEHIFNVLKKFSGVVVYFEYNLEQLPLREMIEKDIPTDNKQFIILHNSNKEAEKVLIEEYPIDGVNIEILPINLSHYIFNQRVNSYQKFYNKISLISNDIRDMHTLYKNDFLYIDYLENATNNINENDNNITTNIEGYNKQYISSYQDRINSIRASTYVLLDQIYENGMYNPYYFEILNYTLPIAIDEVSVLDKNAIIYNKNDVKSYMIEKNNTKLFKELRNQMKTIINKQNISKTIIETINKYF